LQCHCSNAALIIVRLACLATRDCVSVVACSTDTLLPSQLATRGGSMPAASQCTRRSDAVRTGRTLAQRRLSSPLCAAHATSWPADGRLPPRVMKSLPSVRPVNSSTRARTPQVRRERHCAMSRRLCWSDVLFGVPHSPPAHSRRSRSAPSRSLVRQREVSDSSVMVFLRPQSGVQAQDCHQPPGPTSWLVFA